MLRFAIPSTLGPDAPARANTLQGYIHAMLGIGIEVTVAQSYEQVARELLSGAINAAWAPPFVCARIEAMGVRVLLRGIRNGASTYRSALVCRSISNLELETLPNTRAAFSDRDSVGGYLLAMAHLKSRGMNVSKCFAQISFEGSYRQALQAVDEGRADVTAIFAASANSDNTTATGLAEIWPEKQNDFRTICFTEGVPNDGVAVSMTTDAAVVAALEKVLIGMHHTETGARVLRDCFHAERFELAPRMGYRPLYRIALASL